MRRESLLADNMGSTPSKRAPTFFNFQCYQSSGTKIPRVILPFSLPRAFYAKARILNPPSAKIPSNKTPFGEMLRIAQATKAGSATSDVRQHVATLLPHDPTRPNL